jgi:hypothetical protein
MSDGGKGSGRRPKAISDQQYEQRWDLIFGKDQDETSKPTQSGQQPIHKLEDGTEPSGQRQVA